MDYSGMSIPKFSRHIGLKAPDAIRELINGRTKTLSEAVEIHITRAYPNISQEWLHKGTGEMFDSSPDNPVNIRQDHNNNSTMFGYVNIAVPEKGKQKILNSNGIVIETNDDASAQLEHYKAMIGAKDEQISRLLSMIEEKDKTIASLLAKI